MFTNYCIALREATQTVCEVYIVFQMNVDVYLLMDNWPKNVQSFSAMLECMYVMQSTEHIYIRETRLLNLKPPSFNLVVFVQIFLLLKFGG